MDVGRIMPTLACPRSPTLRREVSATPVEFRRGLEQAFPNGVAEHEGALTVGAGETAMALCLTVGTPRHIARLTLPTLHVEIRHLAGSPADFEALLARMDRAMQRGGG